MPEAGGRSEAGVAGMSGRGPKKGLVRELAGRSEALEARRGADRGAQLLG